jgi:outer membrane protein OmpA-like peptidoglycan-associated protein
MLHGGHDMSTPPVTVSVRLTTGALLFVVLSVPTPVFAETPTHVRVVNGSAAIQQWYRPTDVVTRLEQGTTLPVLDREDKFYWVLLPRDGYGTQRSGWIRVSDVEPIAAPVPPSAPRPSTAVLPADGGTAAEKDVVTITERHDAAAPEAGLRYSFADVHFDRNRHALRTGDVDALRATVTALKADPSLTLTLEGHTCSLGSKSHNQALGALRAEAVKNYLVSEGIAADRLHTISRGEEHPAHDNAREETRRLNRRVAVVPEGATN